MPPPSAAESHRAPPIAIRWAECSLVMAENVLVQRLGLSPPSWVNASVYDEYVKFHAETAQRERRAGWHQG